MTLKHQYVSIIHHLDLNSLKPNYFKKTIDEPSLFAKVSARLRCAPHALRTVVTVRARLRCAPHAVEVGSMYV